MSLSAHPIYKATHWSYSWPSTGSSNSPKATRSNFTPLLNLTNQLILFSSLQNGCIKILLLKKNFWTLESCSHCTPSSSPPFDPAVPQLGTRRALCCPPCLSCRAPQSCSSASPFYWHISYMQHTVKGIQDVTWGLLKYFIIKYFKLIMCDS